MSKLDIINAEIETRKQTNTALISGAADLQVAIEAANKLDEFYRDQEKDVRNLLECIYKEDKHFTGEWPIVYGFSDIESYPYTPSPIDDASCNPYYPVTKILDKTFDGLSPLQALPTKTGAHQRQRTFAATEDIPRIPTIVQLQNFPDISAEPLPANWPAAQDTTTTPGYCTPTATPDTEAQCTIEGGIWTPESIDLVPDPVWVGPDTAPALLRVVLVPWRADLVIIRDNVCDDAAEVTYWQGIIDDIDIVLAAVAVDAVFVRNDPDADPATWGQTQAFTGADEAARARLETAADTGVLAHIATRSSKLSTDAATEETIFFGIMGLRLHQINGSYSKVQNAKLQVGSSDSIIADNEAAIELLNLMKVKNS